MTDEQICQYLVDNNYKIKAQDGIINILNRSYKIIDTIYDFDTGMMTIITPNNKFTFKWILGKYE
jgi:hypothetical protein